MKRGRNSEAFIDQKGDWKKKMIGALQIKYHQKYQTKKEQITEIMHLNSLISNSLIKIKEVQCLPHSKENKSKKAAKKCINELADWSELADGAGFGVVCSFSSSQCFKPFGEYVLKIEISLTRACITQTSFSGPSFLYTVALFGGSDELMDDIIERNQIKDTFNEKNDGKPNSLKNLIYKHGGKVAA